MFKSLFKIFKIFKIILFLSIPFVLIVSLNVTKGVSDWLKLRDFESDELNYVKSQDIFLQRRYLIHNPIDYLFSNSLAEVFRIKSFDSNKKILPLITRPSIVADSQWRTQYIKSLLTNKEFINDINFPALRAVISDNSKPKGQYNVVLMFLETWERSDSCTFNVYDHNATPFFDELKKKSVVLEQLFGNSQASYEGQSAVSLSIPIWGVINAKYTGNLIETRMQPYLNLFKNHGYQTRFLTSWDASFYKLTGLGARIYKNDITENPKKYQSKLDIYTTPFTLCGVEQVSDLYDEYFESTSVPDDFFKVDSDFVSESGLRHKTYYLSDEFFYSKLYNTMDKIQQPFFLITHNYSSHAKMPLADDFKPPQKIDIQERYYHSMRYSDDALSTFFEKIKDTEFYKNTIFVLVSDHTYQGNKCSVYGKYHIPGLIFAPGLLEPRTIKEPTFHVDIGPTLVDLANLDGQYTSLGASVFNENLKERGMILPDWDGYLVFVKDDYMLKTDMKSVISFYNYKKDENKNLVDDEAYADLIKDHFELFYKTYTTLADPIYSNKLMPN